MLAFFIVLQTFGPAQAAASYHAGIGSFLGLMRPFGPGGVFEEGGGKVIHAETGPRYKAAEGQEEPPALRRIDPELEEAQLAMQALEEQFDVRAPQNATGYRVELSTPCTYQPGKEALTPEEAQFLEGLAIPLERVVMAKGFVVRLGTVLGARQAQEPGAMLAALTATARVRDRLIQGMSPAGRRLAAHRVYSFLSVESGLPRASAASGQLKIDILLTKPYARRLGEEGGKKGDQGTAA
jgi:hypothetical protein